MTDITVAPVGLDERRALDGWLGDAAQHGIDVDHVGSISDAYDRYLDEMVERAPADREDPTAFCTMIGFAMGEYLVRRTDLDWRVVTDADGTDLALATPAEDAVLFPADPVTAAWEAVEVGWMPGWVGNLMAGLQGSVQ